MSTGSRERTPAVTRVALAGLAAGAAGSSFLAPGMLAGYTAVGLAVAVGLTLYSLGDGGRILPALGAALVMAYPLAVAERGESGIIWAATLTFLGMAGAFVLRGLKKGVVTSLAVSMTVVLHVGLLGTYIVLVAATGNRLLGALVVMVAAFEAAHGVVGARSRKGVPAPPAKGATRTRSRRPEPKALLDPKAALFGVAACTAASALARLFLPRAPGLLNSVVLGVVVGAAAILGHAAAAATLEDLESGPQHASSLDAGVFTSLNALLFTAGAFYYGFRLYLA